MKTHSVTLFPDWKCHFKYLYEIELEDYEFFDRDECLWFAQCKNDGCNWMMDIEYFFPLGYKCRIILNGDWQNPWHTRYIDGIPEVKCWIKYWNNRISKYGIYAG